MQHQVILYRQFTHDTKPRKCGFIDVMNADEAKRIAKAMLDEDMRMHGVAAVKFWQPDGGSVTLDHLQMREMLRAMNGDSTGKPSVVRHVDDMDDEDYTDKVQPTVPKPGNGKINHDSTSGY